MDMGVDYNMGAISLGLGYTNVTNKNVDGWKRTAMDLSLGYNLNDNANLGLRYVTDKSEGGAVDSDDKYMWMTLTVTP